MQIIRAVWKPVGIEIKSYMDSVPNAPEYDEVVYLWEEENVATLEAKGYKTRLIVSDKFNDNGNQFGRKLLAIEAALKEFGEVLFMDWDCSFVKPMDSRFFELLAEKETQIPIYAHPYDNPWESSFKLEENVYISSNFGFVYSRDKQLGERLVNLAVEHDVHACVEEFVFNMEVTGLQEYAEKYLPKIGYGVAKEAVPKDHYNYPLQQKAWDFADAQHEMEIYLKHI